jgi:hypothetical protein
MIDGFNLKPGVLYLGTWKGITTQSLFIVKIQNKEALHLATSVALRHVPSIIKLSSIKKEPIENLPLYINWPWTHPSLSKIIKQGKL